jgi:hypothetical protein
MMPNNDSCRSSPTPPDLRNGGRDTQSIAAITGQSRVDLRLARD